MKELDDLRVYSQLDPLNMQERILELPQHCLRAWQQAQDIRLPPDYSTVNKLIILGMGGSAIGGNLLSALISTESKIQISVHRDYDLPLFADERTLVIASSYSGMTEETLSGFNQSLLTPAKKLVMSTGGKLKTLAQEHRIPVFTIDYVAQPRAALAYSFFPLLCVCQNLGLITDKTKDIEEMMQVLNSLQTDMNTGKRTSGNLAKQIALELYNRLSVIYGAGFLSPVARRWKTQINENSKGWAFFEELPELNHNAVVGYEFPSEIVNSAFVILLRSPQLHRRNLARYSITAELLSKAKVSHRILDGYGKSPLSQTMSLVLLGDWISYYLAVLYKTDPSPVKVIDYLKKRLAQS